MILGRRDLFYRNVVDAGDAAAQHRHALEIVGARCRHHGRLQGRDLIGLDIDEIEAWCARRHGAREIAEDAALDQRHRDQDGEAQPDGQHDAGNRGGAAAESRQRKAQGTRAVARPQAALTAMGGGLDDRGEASESGEGRDRSEGKAGGQHLVLRGRHHQSRERKAGEADRDRVLAVDGAKLDRGGAEQLRGLGAACAQQRGQRECERGQRAEGGSAQQRRGVDAGRDIHVDARQRGLEHERRGGADHQRECDRDRRHHADGDEVGGGDLAGGRADTFQHGDDACLALQMRAHRVGDAEPADQERAEADEVEIGAGVLQEIARAIAGILELPDAPAGIGKGGVERVRRGDTVGLRRHLEAIGVIDQAAGLNQSGRVERRLRDQQPRAEREDLGGGIGLALDRGGDDELRPADRQAIADRQLRALEQHTVRERAIGAVGLARQQFGERLLTGERERAIERIAIVGRFQLDQDRQRAVFRRLRHRAHLDDMRDLAIALDRRQLVRRRGAVRQAHFHVAAQDRLGIGRDPADRRRADGADAGDGGNAEDEARDEQAKAMRAGAQFACGKTEGEEEGVSHARHTPIRPLLLSSWSGLVRPSTSLCRRDRAAAGKFVDGRAKHDHDEIESGVCPITPQPSRCLARCGRRPCGAGGGSGRRAGDRG